MVGRVAGGTVFALMALAGAARAQQASGALPPGVTAQMVKEGETLYKGAGLCSACHGQDGKGIPNLGANLADAEWVHSKGSYDEIVKQIVAGVTADKSKTGVVMPPRGGTNITDAQIKAIAAYVWSLSNPPKK